jgi:hypothetical protein
MTRSLSKGKGQLKREAQQIEPTSTTVAVRSVRSGIDQGWRDGSCGDKPLGRGSLAAPGQADWS